MVLYHRGYEQVRPVPKQCSLGINGEGISRGQPANPESPEKNGC